MFISKIYKIWLGIFLLFANVEIHAQDYLPLLMHPAYRSINPAENIYRESHWKNFNAVISYRDQWNALDQNGGFRMYFAQAMYKVRSSPLDYWDFGLAFSGLNSGSDLLKRNNISTFLSYTRQLLSGGYSGEQLLFSLGTSVSYNQYNLAGSDLWFGRQFNNISLSVDRSLPSGENFEMVPGKYFSLQAGASMYYKWNRTSAIQGGISVNNLNEPATGFIDASEKMNRLYAFYMTHHYRLAPNIEHSAGIQYLSQSALRKIILQYLLSFEFNQEDSEMELGIAPELDNNLGGTGLNTLNLIFGLRYQAYGIRFGYSFDLSSLNNYTAGNGGFGISLSYQAGNR